MPANLLHEQKGGARSGQKAPDRTLRVFNLTESFAADSAVRESRYNVRLWPGQAETALLVRL